MISGGTPSPCVVDTNVPLVANRASTASQQCVLACAGAMREIISSGHLVVDNAWRIVGEYKHQLNATGQPGPGDAFLKWVLTNLMNSDRCTQVEITPLDDDTEDFAEFPAALRAIGFDRSDRKFVAVAVAHEDSPPILQAFDSKWWGWRELLEEAVITVEFLCEAEIEQKYKEKMGKP